MTFDPNNLEYWSEESLLSEERRIFDICHGCRLCFNMCPSFPALFNVTDKVGGHLSQANGDDFRETEELCFQCKLCYVRCPYTPPHEYSLDFPRVMMRAKLVHSKTEGVSWQDKLLGETELVGKLGSITAPLSNIGNALPPNRIAMQAIIGIHKKAELPRFHRQTFTNWFKKYKKSKPAQTQSKRKSAFFHTCFVNYNDPEIGKACIKVLEKNGIEAIVPNQKCCGMPFLDGGMTEKALDKIKYNLQSLKSVVDKGYDIVVPNPTCAYMLKQEYPTMTGDSEDAKTVASHSFEFGEYLKIIGLEGKLNKDFKSKAGKIAFHAACHTRAQFIGNPSADILGLIPDGSVKVIERCSGHDGTWGVKKKYHDLSLEVGDRLFQSIQDCEPDVTVSDCPLASLQIHGATGKKPVHTSQVLMEAYGIA